VTEVMGRMLGRARAGSDWLLGQPMGPKAGRGGNFVRWVTVTAGLGS
jgi:hypothetical protein